MAKEISEYLYVKKGCLKAAPKRKRLLEPADILESFGFVVVGNYQENHNCDYNLVAFTLLSTMARVNDHYTYCPVRNK